MPDQGIVEPLVGRLGVGEGGSIQRGGMPFTEDVVRDLGDVASAVRQFNSLLEGVPLSDRLDMVESMINALTSRIDGMVASIRG